MPIGRSSVAALLLAALALTSPVTAAQGTLKQGSLFQRVTRALADVGSALGGGMASDAAASAMEDMGAARAHVQPQQQQQQQQQQQHQQPGVDTWATDGALKLATKAFSGGQFAVLRLLGQQEELKELWAQPEAVRMLLDNFTMFRGIKKMAAIADKQGPLTAEDGLAALGAFQEYIQASATALEGVLDPAKFAQKIYDYQTTREPMMRSLFERVESGDVEAMFSLQEELVKRDLGDIVDLEEFGLRGEEPTAVTGLREMIKQQDPAIYKLILQDDEFVSRFMADPGAAYKDAQAIDPSLKKVAEAVAAGSRRRKRQLAAEAEAIQEREAVAA